MFINPEVEAMAKKRYEDMKSRGVSSEIFDEKTFDKLELFINTEPSLAMMTFHFESDTVYLGSNELLATP